MQNDEGESQATVGRDLGRDEIGAISGEDRSLVVWADFNQALLVGWAG